MQYDTLYTMYRIALPFDGKKTTSFPVAQDLLLLQHICWDKEPSQATEVRVWLLERMRRLAQAGEDFWVTASDSVL